MRTKLIALVAAVAVMGGIYLMGYVPQRRLRVEAEARLEALQARLTDAEARVRTGRLLGQALTVKESVMRQNYGQALDLSSAFFNEIRVEAGELPAGPLRDGAAEVLAKRDAVTAALAKGEPAVLDAVREIEFRLRLALGYPAAPDAPRALP